MECWAAQLGGCAGPRSGEHYMTKALFEGPSVTIHGLSFCRGTPLTIPLEKARANILCRRHNELLSPADGEAAKFQNAVEKLQKRPHLTKDRKMQSAPSREVLSGKRLSQWITKTYCNFATMGKNVPSKKFVEHSFSGESDLRFYLYVFESLLVEYDRGHVTFFDYFDDIGNVVWCGRIGGVIGVGTTVNFADSGDRMQLGKRVLETNRFLLRPKKMYMQQEIGNRYLTTGLLELEW